jgi:hypothetical protein
MPPAWRALDERPPFIIFRLANGLTLLWFVAKLGKWGKKSRRRYPRACSVNRLAIQPAARLAYNMKRMIKMFGVKPLLAAIAA